jgi:hypothetical protein
MTAELGAWLTELGDSEPATAAEVGAALIAVLEAADPPGLAIVEPSTQSADPRETADYAYRQLLESLQRVRRRVADVATTRKRLSLRLHDRRGAGADAAEIAELERDLVAAQQGEEVLTEQSQRLQRQVDAFRTATESAKAIYTVAEARLRIAEALEAAGDEPDDDLDQLRENLREAERKLSAARSGAAVGVIRQPQPSVQAGTEHPAAPEPHSSAQPLAQRPMPPSPQQPAAVPAPGLLELRADPLGSDIRILFALEPAGTATLLAVLEGPEALSEHGLEAIRLSSKLLTEIRDGGWPNDIDEVVLGDAGAFLARFFPANDGSIIRRASVLAETRPLSKLRADLQLTIGDVAARSGIEADRVAAIERDGLRAAEVHEAVALARALGARLELPAGSGPVLG